MESMTDWAFSCPISDERLVYVFRRMARLREKAGFYGSWRLGRTLIVVDNVAQVVASAVVGFAHAHRVVREIDIAVVAWRVVSSY